MHLRLRGGADLWAGIANDLSLGGVCVETEFRAPDGTAIDVLLAIPGDPQEHVFPAMVRWTGPVGVGIHFESLDARQTHAIAHAIAFFGAEPASLDQRCTSIGSLRVTHARVPWQSQFDRELKF